MSVRPDQRHKKNRPCLVCRGGDNDRRGQQKRCSGFISEDGEYEHCSREEHAGGLMQEAGGTYAHRMHGPCKCGETHGEAKSGTIARADDIEATYDYRDERGNLLFQVVRKSNKRFLQRRPHGSDWVWQTSGVRRVLYRLPELLAADKSKTVYVCEGEKDVATMVARGEVATTNPGGAGKWGFVAQEAVKVLADRHVIVIADADDAGRPHAEQVASSLRGVAKKVRVVEPPPPSKDLTAFVESGGDVATWIASTEPTPRSLAPEIPFDELWTTEPDAELVIPALGIAPGPVHTVIGSWYTGKTLFLMSMGIAVASGKSLFGVWGTRRGRWVHFDYEMGRRHIKRYLQRLVRGMGVAPEDLRGQVSIRSLPQLNLTTDGASELYEEILTGASLVTIDPLRSAARGADENKSEFREHLDLIASVSEKARCPVVLLHHAGKPNEGAERRHTGRGTSAIDDAAQTKFVLSAKKKGAPILVSHEKTRELTQTLGDFYLEIDNSIPDAVRLVHREPEEVDPGDAPDLMAKTKAAILACLSSARTDVCSRNMIADRLPGRRSAVMEAMREMFETGELVQVTPDGPIRRSSTGSRRG